MARLTGMKFGHARHICGSARRLYARTLGSYAAVLASGLRLRRNFVVEQHDGAQTLAGAKRVAVFAQYDSRGFLHDYVVFHLEALHAAGYAIVFVSNSARIDRRALFKLIPICAKILRRDNVGHDFGAYKDGLSCLGALADLDELILANDSVYGPLHDLATILSGCDSSADIWGITDSWSRRYHLQSYFMLFKQTALCHPGFAAFWQRMRHVQSRHWVIDRYEIGLTQQMLRLGLSCSALYPYRSAVSTAIRTERLTEDAETPQAQGPYYRDAAPMLASAKRGTPLNPTHHLWDTLTLPMKCPFIKRDLIARNPVGIANTYLWEDLMRQVSSYDTNLIIRHMQATQLDRAI